MIRRIGVAGALVKEDQQKDDEPIFSNGKSNASGNSNGHLHKSSARPGFSKSCRQAIRPFLPSNYIKWLLPPMVYRLACYGSYLFWFTIGWLVLRKTQNATRAVRYIKTYGHTVSLESIEKSMEFAQLVD
uniref:Uncharacterized protein n=1 Tax=Ditylenchus dipsaci TaxID=166011 RepID=A0A915E961_9BILA